MKLWSFFWF